MGRKIVFIENDVVTNEIDVDREIAEIDAWMKEHKPKRERLKKFVNWVRILLIVVWGFSIYSLCDAFFDHDTFGFYWQLVLVLATTANLSFYFSRI